MKFYIKPQQIAGRAFTAYCCILLKFYIKPQLAFLRACAFRGCILLKFYIKPQHGRLSRFFCRVVSYWNSTSNHNSAASEAKRRNVVSYWNSTSNHNSVFAIRSDTPLYLIEILHQTTTQDSQGLHFRRCILLKFYIKPQRRGRTTFSCVSCILLKFYIKPQRSTPSNQFSTVVSYWNSTSNHNIIPYDKGSNTVVSYWNSTSNHNPGWFWHSGWEVVSYWNSTSNHNLCDFESVCTDVVSYWNSTSNHNPLLRLS